MSGVVDAVESAALSTHPYIATLVDGDMSHKRIGQAVGVVDIGSIELERVVVGSEIVHSAIISTSPDSALAVSDKRKHRLVAYALRIVGVDIYIECTSCGVETVEPQEGANPYISVAILGNLTHAVAADMILRAPVLVVLHGIVVISLGSVFVDRELRDSATQCDSIHGRATRPKCCHASPGRCIRYKVR